MVPRPVDATGRFLVDATWGTINPIELAPGVRTVGELEVVAQIERGLPIVDVRPERSFAAATIPTARNIPHAEIGERIGELDATVETVVFCNGPQCAASPDAVRTLVAAGYPPGRLLYYRGGMHDWLTLGLPAVRGRR